MRIFKAMEEKKQKEEREREEREREERREKLLSIKKYVDYRDANLLPTLNYIIDNVPVLVEKYRAHRKFSIGSKGPFDNSILHELNNKIKILQEFQSMHPQYLNTKASLQQQNAGGESELLKYGNNAIKSAHSIQDMYEQVLLFKNMKDNIQYTDAKRAEYKSMYNQHAGIFNKSFNKLCYALISDLQSFIDYFAKKLNKYSIKTTSNQDITLSAQQAMDNHERIQEALARQFTQLSLSRKKEGGKKTIKKVKTRKVSKPVQKVKQTRKVSKPVQKVKQTRKVSKSVN
jgi:hypothetical protein